MPKKDTVREDEITLNQDMLWSFCTDCYEFILMSW